jgi:type 2 lantibiotic biosynthesis protein LanM
MFPSSETLDPKQGPESLLSPDRLARIAVNSLSLWERRAANLRTESPNKPQEIETRLEQWRNAACEGDATLFLERLARDGLDVTDARRLSGPIDIPCHFKLPEWCDVLNRVLEAAPRLQDAATSPEPATKFPYLKSDDPLPFEQLFLPFVETAHAQLAEDGAGKLPAQVLNAFARDLLRKLADIAARVLAVEFRAFLASRQFDDHESAEAEPGINSRAQYHGFIAEIYQDGWAPLFEEYCVMARLLAETVTQWVGNIGEFERRLFDDLPEIKRTFNRREPTGGAIAVQTGLSDPHDGGRTVISVEFSSGLKLIYKPRSFGLERAYFDFAAWINRFGALLPFRILTILDRGDYGWVEYVEHRSCASDAEIRRYYRRTGHFLCLVYALNGSDFHFENMIADGEHPVPIDLETIYHHRAKIAAGDADEMAARLRVSVLATDLLPDPVKVDHQYFDISGLARSEQEEGEADLVVWKHINTDGMDYCYELQRPPPAHNLPKLNGKVAALNDYTDIILGGFEEAYRFLREKADVLLDESGPLRSMFAHESRFIYRSTALYSLILRRALHPAYLGDGVDFGTQLDVLARKLLSESDTPITWPLLQAETVSLWRLDVPRFTARGDENALSVGFGNPIVECFVDSAWNAARTKISGLSEEDLQWQLSLIVGSFDVRSANLGTDPSVATASEEHEEYPEIEPLRRDELLQAAAKLADEIEAKAFRQSNGDLGWMVLNYAPATERYTLQPMENDLYNGRAGVGLFFAALEKISPGSSYRALAHASLKPIRRWIKRAPDEELTEFGFGGYAGLSSIAYALTRAGEFLGEDELIADARLAALRIRADRIEKDDSLDAMNGAAGAIPALLACYGATGEPEVLARAIACGRHLLQRRALDKFGFKTWPTLDGCHLTGFSHGAAGIAYALLQLYKITADAEFYQAAVDGICFEGCAFVREQNNWPDYRRSATGLSQDPMFCMAWCHGAPGIGLGRIAALDMMDTCDVRRDIEAALASTSSAHLLPRDHLCCGNAGLMDTLCAAGERFPHGEWSRKALQLAARTMARGNKRGGFNIAFHNGFFNSSLFQGTAGVGYQLLRLADPTKIPSVLLLN